MKRKLARAVIPALLGWIGAVSYWIAAGPDEPRALRADTAVVLGAAVYGDEPSPVFRERIKHALELYDSGKVRSFVLTGGKAQGDGFTESEVAEKVIRQEAPEDAEIWLDRKSRTTRENLVEAKRLMDEADLTSAIIVSDPLHMRRAMEMAEDLGIAAMPSATPTTRYRSFWPKAKFLMRETFFMHHYWLFGK